jgi:hypothetical protein
LEVKDWLQDPFMENRGYRELKSLNTKQDELWRIFHYSTRLKLNGADFFCRQVIDTARMSENTQLEWYLDAFFFELMAACDILLQELNIVYAYDLSLKPEGVRWNNKNKNKFMKKLPEEIFNLIEEERKKERKIGFIKSNGTETQQLITIVSPKVDIKCGGEMTLFILHMV